MPSARSRRGGKPAGSGQKAGKKAVAAVGKAAAPSGSAGKPSTIRRVCLATIAALIVVITFILPLYLRSHRIAFNRNSYVLCHAALCAFFVAMLAPARQSQAYHCFADGRSLCQLSNMANVASNAPFLLVGAAGVLLLVSEGGGGLFPRAPQFVLAPALEAQAWTLFFAGLATVSVGSAYYHLRPNDSRLVWDRLPMSVCFALLYAIMVEERCSAGLLPWALPFAMAGAGSVALWALTAELRPYILLQFVPMLSMPVLILLFPAPYTYAADYELCLALYVLAKVTEAADGAIYRATARVVSGHTIKHLLAAAACAVLVRMLAMRTPLPASPA
eukprot:PLAT13482.1.p2 GENE.PLAT13482.1~~PLAT13482.1.p2  ORF type:complete len:332 (-),score=118.31 PLAT13482.1:73-1068(-)